ncbi:NOT2/NOT3/NOT5 C-terminal domain-containing protein [Forsythia ovata]|uniref:NOT2/NOT3/NOT5 C-terminal domain-containing protein n=1 Tax=Forsythia ovata TaxID=205694 RepID=A0ABD1W1W4_9LAMI
MDVILLMQLSLGGSHGHSGVTNVGGYAFKDVISGQGVLPNVVNTGRIAHSVGHLVGGGNITITSGLGSAGMANQAGPSSRLNLTELEFQTLYFLEIHEMEHEQEVLNNDQGRRNQQWLHQKMSLWLCIGKAHYVDHHKGKQRVLQ